MAASLLCPGANKSIGKLSEDSKVDIRLIQIDYGNKPAIMGFGLRFSRHKMNTGSSFFYNAERDGLNDQPSDDLVITVCFPRGNLILNSRKMGNDDFIRFHDGLKVEQDEFENFAVIEITLNEGSDINVRNYGLPFVGCSPTVDSYVNRDEPIDNIITLHQIFSQRQFTFVTKANDKLRMLWAADLIPDRELNPRYPYPYDDNHEWNLERFKEQVFANRSTSVYLRNWLFASINDMTTNYSHQVIQDNLSLMEDVARIGQRRLPCALIQRTETPETMFGIVATDEHMETKYSDTWKRIIRTNRTFHIHIVQNVPPISYDPIITQHTAESFDHEQRIETKCVIHPYPEAVGQSPPEGDLVLQLPSVLPSTGEVNLNIFPSFEAAVEAGQAR